MQSTELKPTPGGTDFTNRWMVVIYNNDVTSFDDVVDVLVQSTKCSVDEAEIEAWEAHTFSRASVHFADEATCAKIATMIEAIGVKTEVVPEWLP